MQPGARQADHLVADPDVLAVEDLFPLHDSEAEPGQVVLAGLVELRQDGRLAADQGALGLDAAVADPLHHLGREVGVVPAHGHVIQEQQRLGASAQAVVDGHGHQVDAHRGVPARGEGQLQLRPHAVRRGNQHGIAIGPRQEPDLVVEPEEPGKAVLPLHDARRVGPAHQGRQTGHRLLVGAQVHAGRSIVQGITHSGNSGS